jgi:hypothetical protein
MLNPRTTFRVSEDLVSVPDPRAFLFPKYIDALGRSEETADDMDHWREVGAFRHDALAVKYGRQHNPTAGTCVWLLGSGDSLQPAKPSRSSQGP